MSFFLDNFRQPLLLWGLPLVLLPIIIHLINQHRHRTVQWAAMMFLLDAKKMTKGMARLRQIFILAMRVLAVAALIFAAGRPLASGWVALTAGSDTDSIIILLDRSASMEQQNLQTGESKRSTALAKITDFLEKTAQHTQVVLIDSVTLESTEIDSPEDLLDFPSTVPTDTTADIPALLQTALDYITVNKSGRTDIWLASDLRTMDWDSGDGRWENLRSSFSELEGIRFYLLNYPDIKDDNLFVRVENLKRRRGPDGIDLIMDVSVSREGNPATLEPLEVPLEFTINGTRTIQNVTIEGNELSLQGHTISLGTSETAGWGRVDLPADGNLQDNTFFFVFGDAPVQKTVIVSDDPQVIQALRSAAEAPADPNKRYQVEVFTPSGTAEIPWSETALLFWHTALPTDGSAEAALLGQFVDSGKSLVLLPPEGSAPSSFLGFSWGDWSQDIGDALEIGWWRTDSGLLANTRNGNPLPLGDLKIFRTRFFKGENQVLLKLKGNEEVIARLITEKDGEVFVWGTLPSATYSSMASDGVAFFVMIHRALDRGARSLANAQLREAKPGALSAKLSWKPLNTRESGENALDLSLHAGIFESAAKKRLIALNRPAAEDDQRVLTSEQLAILFAGLDYSEIKDEVGNETSLASEIWKAFLVAMALALLIEAALCIPPRPDPVMSSM